MSWSQTRQAEHLHDRMTILIGSAIQMLGGNAGVFVVANEAFDPQSSSEYTLYRLNSKLLSVFIANRQEGERLRRIPPHAAHLLTIEPVEVELAQQLDITDDDGRCLRELERCSLFLYDTAGMVGTLYFVRPTGTRSCFEQSEDREATLRLFVAHVSAGLRAALKEQALLKEQARLAAIFHYSTEGILTVDSAFRIIDFNPAMEHLTGWRESEVLGRFYYDVLRPKDRQGNDVGLEGSPLLQAMAGQAVVDREMMITARDGQTFAVSVTASYVRSPVGEPMNGILTVRDVTREREQEEQRSTFISIISHELQTPIAIIKGYASTLARANAMLKPEVLRPRLIAIEEEADRLNKLVGNLLYASRIQAGGLQMEVGPLDLGSLVEKMVQRLKAKSPDVTVHLDLPAHLPIVMADRDRIEEVLQNLLDNAVKYSPRERLITVSCRATGEEVVVSVSDTGMGISLRDQEHIFERFHRVGNGMTRSTPGAGLGLYICRAIVEAHGGRIWVDSTLHQGSTFYFSLPRVEKAQLPMVVF